MTGMGPFGEVQLVAWGKKIGRCVRPPAFFALRGPLGAGKSVFARAVARGAGVVEVMPSPTFNLSFRYPARSGGTVVHMDLYRIQDPEELTELEWDELGEPGELALVEWAERAGERLPADYWDLLIEPVRGRPGLRRISLTRVGDPPPLPKPDV